MLIDIQELSENTLIESDICIVGGGAAGITLAREFIDQPYQVCLLESGGLDFEEATQSLYEAEHIGVPFQPLGESRARYLGGSTNLWGGWSRPFDDIDFEDRPWMPYSGWPIPKAELNPYYQRARKVCGLGSDKYDFADWEDAFKELQLHRLPLPEQIETYIWQIVPPTHLRFGQAYRAELEQASNIKTYLHANVVEVETNEVAKTATRLRVATLEGKKFWVSAKAFILAVGGIENPRLLLASNQVQSNGLGNQHDLVGRFFMEHPHLPSGKILLSNPAALYTQNIRVGETFLATGLGLSQKVQEQEQILNFSARLIPQLPDWVKAFNNLKYRLRQQPKTVHEAFPTIGEGQRYRSDTSALEDLSKVIANLDRVAARAYAKLFDKSFHSRQSNLCQTHLIGEQAPNPDSRIKLSAERDKLGINRVQLDWRLSPIDKYTMQRSQQILAEEFAHSGLGQVQNELNDDDTFWQPVRGSYHHMGTTRMSTNPKQGVVNENCRVHGISNLYVAGSSVFPTSGLSNPTLTLIALAVRLADHLKETMANQSTTVKAEDLQTAG
ncbi:MAG: GMC family oxidoreductase [Xenococcaceae cyanobacterium MO_188.B32]|nr:GMC family oxidoreductase [Xenococcaceae cyanobacterium MO_188.B32]